MSLLCMVAVVSLGARATDAQVKKDVPYVPTPEEVVAEMLKQAAIKPGELLYDLGCGDGRIVVTAAKVHGARGVGVDIDPQRIAESNENARKAGVTDRVKFVTGNLFEMDFKDADVLTLYLLPSVNVKLRPKILSELRPGVRVVSHAFDMGDWQPDNEVLVDDEGATVYLWIIPAKAAGRWNGTMNIGRGEQKAELKLEQKYQKVSGTATVDGREYRITDARLRGNELKFKFDGNLAEHTATLDGIQMRGDKINLTRTQQAAPAGN